MKYELTNETRIDGKKKYYRIKCVEAFDDVDEGELGGWIESEKNLSQEGYAWISGDATVFNNAVVSGDARVSDNAVVSGYARISDNAVIYGNTVIYGNARVYGNALVGDDVVMYGNARISGNARVSGDARVSDNAMIYGNARVYGDARVCGSVMLAGDAKICGSAVVQSKSDHAVYHNSWSADSYFTYTASNKMWKDGCFYGTGEELIAKAYKESVLSGRCYEAIVHAQEAIDAAMKAC